MSAGSFRWALGLLALATALLAGVALSGPASASSYPGSGDWVIGAATTEVVTGETISISGNLTVLGSLTFVNSTVTLDRNATVGGTLVLTASSLMFTVDGPGTNYLTAAGNATVRVLDFDGSAATTSDRSLLAADAFAFNSTFAPGSNLTIRNSRVERAGWSVASPFSLRAGFRVDAAAVQVDGGDFSLGFELFIITNSSGVSITNSTFDGVVSPVNLTGGAWHVFSELRFASHTFGLRLASVSQVSINGLTADLPAPVGYAPPLAPPAGTLVAVSRSVFVNLSNVSVVGPPGPAPHNAAGFDVRDSSYVNISNFDGTDGDAIGRFFNVTEAALFDISAFSFDQPLDFTFCSGITVDLFYGAGNRSAISSTNTSNFTLRAATATSLVVPLLLAFGASGWFEAHGVTVTASVGAINVTGSPTAPNISNVSVSAVNYAVALNLTDGSGTRIDGVRADNVTQDVLQLYFQALVQLVVRNLNLTTFGWAGLNLSSPTASDVSVTDGTASDTSGDFALLQVGALDNLTFARVTADVQRSPLLHVESDAVADVDIVDLRCSNSSGSMVVVNGGNISRLRVRGGFLESGNLPPPAAAPAAITLDTSGQSGAHLPGALAAVLVDGLSMNISGRGGVYVRSTLGGSLSIVNLSLIAVQFDGVHVVSNGAPFTLVVENITYMTGGFAAVHLEGVSGGTVRKVTSDSATGVALEDSIGVRVEGVTHSGAAAAVQINGGSAITVDGVVAHSAYGVDAAGCTGVRIANVSAEATGWAVRVSSATNTTITGLIATNSSGGILIRASTGASVVAPHLEFVSSGIQVTLGSTAVNVNGASTSTPLSVTGGTALEVTFSSFVTVNDFVFSGRCTRAALVQSSQHIEIAQLTARSCGIGLELAASNFVNVSGLVAPGAFNGSGLLVSASKDIQIISGDLSGASSSGIIASGDDRLLLKGLDARGADGEGAVLAFVTNTTLDSLVLDNASGTCLRLLYAGKNVTIKNITARFCLAGVELLASSGIELSGVDASSNGGIGVYVDPLSTNNVLRNITAAANLWNGVLVAINKTQLIDGNFSANRQAGIAVTPLIRLDWVIEGSASITDESVDLTGDLTLLPGASFVATRTNLTIEQTVRMRAFEPYARITVGAGAQLTLDHTALAPRDVRLPYAMEIGASASAWFLASTVRGGARADATSSVNASSATIVANGTEFREWHAPLRTQNSSVLCNDCTFTMNFAGPSFAGGSVVALNLTSSDGEGDGLTVTGGATLYGTSIFLISNLGAGAVFDGVSPLAFTGLQSANNGAVGVRISNCDVNASGLLAYASIGAGLQITGGTAVRIGRATLRNNGGAGATATDVGALWLGLDDVLDNGGPGVYLERVASATITGGQVARNAVFGLQSIDVADLWVEGTSFSGDAQGSVLVDGSGRFSFGNGTLTTTANHAFTVLGSTQAILTSAGASANHTGLLAAGQARVYVLNSSMNAPTVLDDAVVTVGWYLRLLIQDPAGYPANGTRVSVINASGLEVANATAGAGGSPPLLAIPERTVFASGAVVTYGPQEVRAEHAFLGRARASVNLTRYTAILLKLDNTAPATTVTLGGPAGQNGWFLGDVTVTLRALDDRPDGVSVIYRVGQSSWERADSDGTTATGALNVGAEGVSVVEYYAIDAAGNTEPVRTAFVRIDRHRPTASFVSPPPLTVFEADLPLSWAGTDGVGGGIESFVIDYSFNGSAFESWLNGTANTTGTFHAADGSYNFRLTAYDLAGQSSDTVFLNVRVALFGTLRMRVTGDTGGLLPNVTVTVVGHNLTETGTGIIELLGLPPGNLTLRISAPGFDPVERGVTVVAGQTTDIGDVTLKPTSPPPAGFDITAGYLMLGALLLITVAYYLRMKQKWDKRAKQREQEASSRKKRKR